MSMEIAPFDFAEASETGLAIREDCPFEAWQAMGETLDRIGVAWQWWYGDWWNFGEARYGEKHAQALPEKDYGTKANAASVASRIEFSRRRENLSFSHHVVVAYLEPHEQDAWLDKAEADNLAVHELRSEVRRSLRRPIAPPAPVDGTFSVLLVDPPWRYDFAETSNREIENQYPTMSLDELMALDVPAADDSVLFMWTTSPKLAESIRLLDAWRFEYVTSAVWVKDKIGMGYWFRQQHEPILVARRGTVSPPPAEARRSSVFDARRTEHSAKPPEVHEAIEAMFPADTATHVELFAREARPGWTSWGNQL